jgi:hypothetical protein
VRSGDQPLERRPRCVQRHGITLETRARNSLT